jgi:aspartate kinase
VDWQKTEQTISQYIAPLLNENPYRTLITQGFIGSTAEGITTTLGREGSDFSAAVFGYCLKAESVTIWKDVDGLLTANPKEFPEAVLLPEISYKGAIELTYYGASVIHPKTLKPLENKHIPLYVKSFLHPSAAGSVIADGCSQRHIPPCITHKDQQILITLFAQDLSFIFEKNIATVFALCTHYGITINLVQNSALSLSLCVDRKEHCGELIDRLQKDFIVKYNADVELFTVSYHDQPTIAKVLAEKEVILEQKNRLMAQYVVRSGKND